MSEITVFSPDLASILKNPNTPIDVVLGKPQIIRAVKIGTQNVVDYMAVHVNEIYELTLTEKTGPIVSRAFTILTMGVTSIIQHLLSGDTFRNRALEVISDQNTSQFVIGRLASIALSALLTLPDKATESCGFLYRLLTFCANPSVFNMFETICSDDPRCPPIQTWLIQMGFEEYMKRELVDNIDYAYSTDENPFFDPIYTKAFCLYKLISKCGENDIMKASFHTKDMVSALSHDFQHTPTHVQNSRWAAIKGITSQTTAVFLLPQISIALNLLSLCTEKLPEYRVTAIEFITEMMILAPMTFDIVVETSIVQSLMTTVLEHPNSSIFIDAFRRFIEVGLRNARFSEMAVHICIPIFIDVCTTRENRVLSPFFFSLMEVFLEAARRNTILKQAMEETYSLRDFYNGPLKKYNNIINNPYGGEPTGPLFKAFKALFD